MALPLLSNVYGPDPSVLHHRVTLSSHRSAILLCLIKAPWSRALSPIVVLTRSSPDHLYYPSNADVVAVRHASFRADVLSGGATHIARRSTSLHVLGPGTPPDPLPPLALPRISPPPNSHCTLGSDHLRILPAALPWPMDEQTSPFPPNTCPSNEHIDLRA
jgi:hypothetical protein